MHYLKTKAIKDRIHNEGKQISRDGLHAIDIKVEQFIEKVVRQHNGSRRRIDMGLINCFKI